ncbi:MAG TPA: hypothetical protein VL921_11240 [Candidatus Udaeobacter sp.]|nr:hypothetical protein [Candidatus Udaeobacter sp.]
MKKRNWSSNFIPILILLLALAIYFLFPTKLFQKPIGPFQIGTASR